MANKTYHGFDVRCGFSNAFKLFLILNLNEFMLQKEKKCMIGCDSHMERE